MVVLGLDAAWTPNRASGIAIITGQLDDWQCAGAFSSYSALFERAGVAELLPAVVALAGAPPDVISVDMPLANVPIVARRLCDNELTRAFVRFGCGVHSSTPHRPGAVSANLMAGFERAGYALAVNGAPLRNRQVIEVYPHIAVMRLLGENYRVPYKIGRIRQYWPEATPRKRQANLRANLRRILEALRARIREIPLELPPTTARPSELKRFEDALDGVVCAWIGAQYLGGKARSYGDSTSAIWVPEI
jgi:predicted RNase H-like nuclease